MYCKAIFFLINTTTLSLDNPLCFTRNVLERISYRQKNVLFQLKENVIVIRDLKTFSYDFDRAKDDDENFFPITQG